MHQGPSDENGSFQQISLSLLLIRALDQRWTGTLIVEPPFDMVHLVQLDRGLVSRVLVPDNYARLGELVVEAGVIMESELDIALQYQGLLGQALAEQRLIDARTLQKALVLQILRRLVRLFDYPPETEWTFLPDLDAFEGMPEGVRVDTLRVLWSGLSAHGEMGDWQKKTLDRIGESPFRIRSDVQLSRFGFTGDAARLVGIINQERATIDRLLAEKATPDEVCSSIVYLLAITRYLEFSPAGESADSAEPIESNEVSDGEEPTSSNEEDRPSQQPPQRVARIKLKRVGVRSPSEDPGDHKSADDAGNILAEIKNRLARLEKESPFTLLDMDPAQLEGLDEEAATERLWEAYERAARRWHPDNCPNELIELREGMSKLHRAITTAFETLAEHDSRERALRNARRDIEDPSSSGERVVVPAVLEGKKKNRPRRRPARTLPSHPDFTDDAAHERQRNLTPSQLHERAFVAMSEQRFTEAIRLAQLACNGAPDNPDYLASAIWIRACMPGADLKVVCLDLDDLLLHHASHVQARYYRGVLRRRLGYDSAAKQDFERVLADDPEHGGARDHLEELSRPNRQNR
ncbi:MAG TPA: hypothetical protein VFB62_23215 [Polyangiaceae bacterium]|nr:hypothetical protein [Polyangiaceae bacterium]